MLAAGRGRIHILPVANPDGYAYSRSTDRLWRKTRSNNSCGAGEGADPNRNWDFHWSETGASGDSCSQTYYGPEPFSEVKALLRRTQSLF